MKHIVDNVNTLNITFKTLDLAGRVPFADAIELLGVELQYHEGRGPLFMGRVRYAINGVKQEEGFPLDLHKGLSSPLSVSKRQAWRINSKP